jgi:hypothetical protein
MSIQKKVFISLLVLGFVVSMFGCGAAKRNAQFTTQLKAKEWRPKVREMADNMGDYDIWAAGRSRARPWAIVFHPKDNPKKLNGTPGRWHKIEDKNVLLDIVGWMESTTRVPRLMSILGPAPERDFYAYVYTTLNQLNTRIEDENTIFVFGPDPAQMQGNL